MRVVLADVEAAPLEAAARAREQGAEALAVVTDVSRRRRTGRARSRAQRGRFGAVHLVCNNAGVFAAGSPGRHRSPTTSGSSRCNVWGVLHGVRAFVPRLLAQDEGHVLITASMASLTRDAVRGALHR